ncbi:hypothetical protein [Bradyrhizobium sp. HKCCYLS20291]|uniref:hypothetical protein n=1 Tax=Bradyrhizobium sp. HKCCYLS20291 TaxID=3420766 RepID=UPI003EBCCFC7
MKSQSTKRMVLLGCAVFGFLNVPSQSWARSTKPQCQIKHVPALLEGWKTALNKSTPQNPSPVLDTYQSDAGRNQAVLLPTCANGPLVGQKEIKGYFEEFLKKSPQVEIDVDKAKINGNCDYAVASGLYEFTLKSPSPSPTVLLRARYTYVFHNRKIVQHHSSVEPDSGPGNVCPPKP